MSNSSAIPSALGQAPSGLIFNLMRFALHDGPGIRTTVFLKGCPLNCWWCHNPESQSFKPELMYSAARCTGCGECCRHCSHDALRWDSRPVRDASLCVLCGDCVEACPADARQLMGRRISVAELVDVLKRDTVFYDDSGGGVTFSGGEPLAQPEFLEAALAECKNAGLTTAVDTSGYAPADTLRAIARFTDLFLYDLKLMDDTRHRCYVGVSNVVILENLSILAREHRGVIVRMPIIPGINDDGENIRESMDFLATLGLRKVCLLPYHQIGADKYDRLQATYRIEDLVPPSSERMHQLADGFAQRGFEVRIGG